MKIDILSRNPKLYSTKQLVQAAQKRGHDVQVLDPLRCFMNINPNKPDVHYRKKIIKPDAIIPRIGSSITFYGAAVVRQFEMGGVYALNGSLAITRARDKLRAHQVLARKGLGMPSTSFADSTRNTKALINLVGGTPLIIKLLEGTQGKGVILAETNKAAESVIEAFRGLNAHLLVQEYIKEAGGSDIRCFVVGEKVVAAMKRQAQEGEFRSNLHKGGTSELVKITPEERKAAVDATNAIGLQVAGVDIIRSERGPLILEVNASPGLEGIEKTTGKNVADLMIDYIEKNADKKPKRRKSKE